MYSMGSDSEDTVHSQNITFMYCWRRIQLGFEGWNGKYVMDLNTVHINLCTDFIILLKVEVIRDYMFQNEKSSNAIRISLWYLSSKDIFQIKTKIIQQNICPHLEWWLKYILLSENSCSVSTFMPGFRCALTLYFPLWNIVGISCTNTKHFIYCSSVSAILQSHILFLSWLLYIAVKSIETIHEVLPKICL